MQQDFRCDCPFTSALDVLGDKWILVIVKQMLIEGRETFKDFTESEEAIATNILSSKLKLLEEYGIIIKAKRPNNRKTNLYLLTEKGLALTPILVELANWSDRNLRDIHPGIMNGEAMQFLRNDKTAFANEIEKKYREKLATTQYKSNPPAGRAGSG
ncbi:MAG: helix-turn-helix domain-containing protein [Bacteroidota bacterium]